MTTPASISIVVPVLNQSTYLGDALQSLAGQGHAGLEAIIQDGGSTDGSIEVAKTWAARDPRMFRLFVEKDAGMGDALNRGFARASGDIRGYLGAADLLLEGALQRVSTEVSAAAGRHVVMGRSLLLLEGMDEAAVDHPAEYLGHFDHLAIWKRRFNSVAAPSLFWHRSVSERLGGFIAGPPYAVDYDFVCRIGTRYPIHKVDEPWSASRVHGGTASAQCTESEMLETWIAISRRYWGTWLSPLRWRCEASHWRYEHQWHEQARHHAHAAESAAARGQRLLACTERLRTALYSPAMARGRFGVTYRRRLERKS